MEEQMFLAGNGVEGSWLPLHAFPVMVKRGKRPGSLFSDRRAMDEPRFTISCPPIEGIEQAPDVTFTHQQRPTEEQVIEASVLKKRVLAQVVAGRNDPHDYNQACNFKKRVYDAHVYGVSRHVGLEQVVNALTQSRITSKTL